ncbi:MAG TPA: PspC domain-containing protein [Jatrophihabitantaceae bacterium]|jgi:signal transduction histidine kinase/phage shock protein PspC (stress-responsive transcriptional regulator)
MNPVDENASGPPRLYRRANRKLLGGVASGIADHLRIPPSRVRLAFILLAFADGLGVILYGAYWIVVPPPPGTKPRSRFGDWVAYAAGAVLVVAAVFGVTRTMPLGSLLIPVTLAIFGGALIWRQASEGQRESWWRSSQRSLGAGGTVGRIRLIGGAALVLTGGTFVVVRANSSTVSVGLLAVVVTVIGLVLLSGPWWMRMVSDLSDERRERIRSQERAELAAHLHDSVLQTLALIQRNAGSPREVTRLARGQERELRTLLYGMREASGQLSEALKSAAADVEDSYAIKVDAVVVGDAPLDDRLDALALATREALVNAAKHAGVDEVSLYAEVEDDACLCFVRDRGVGFDIEAVNDDRQGLRGSIIGRIERHGGQVSVRSSPGTGTEVEIRMPR